MSQKITAKNLQYDASLPPFLARLRGQQSSFDGPDPILAGQRRSAKPRSGSAEAEDAPLVVDDEGNVVDGVQVGRDGAVKDERPATDNTPGAVEDGHVEREGEASQPGEPAAAETMAGIGGVKKRKVAKIVGGDRHGDVVGGEQNEERRKKVVGNKVDGPGQTATGEKAAAKNRKKAKKVKLSFGDDEG